MPVPTRRHDEERSDFLNRCMSDPKMREEYEYDQRFAVCNTAAKTQAEEVPIVTAFDDYKFNTQKEAKEAATKLGLTMIHSQETDNGMLYWIPGKDMDELRQALWFQKDTEEDTATSEPEPQPVKVQDVIYADTYIDVGEPEEYALLIGENFLVTSKSSAEAFKGKKITLNKPFSTSDQPTEYAVYTRGSDGGLIMLRFNSDPNVPRNDLEQKWTTKYWQYKMK